MPRLAVNQPIKPLALFAKRWLFAAAVVFAVYNPSGHSYWHWATGEAGSLPLKVAVGIALLAVAVATLRMAFASIGFAGIAAVLSLILASLLLQDGLGWLAFEDVRLTQVTVLVWIATVLAVGLSWSFYQRRISGERDVLRDPP